MTVKISLRQLLRPGQVIDPVYGADSRLTGIRLRRKSGRPVWNNHDGMLALKWLENDAQKYVQKEYGHQKILQNVFGGLGD